MEELIQKAKNGDKEAFTTIMLSLEKDLYKIAKTRLKNDDDIYDAIQETIIEAFKSIKKLKNTEAFKTWIIRILINKTNDIFRRKKHKKEILLENIKNTEILNSYEEKDIDNLLDFNFMRKQLKYEDSVIINLYYLEGFSDKEIGNILKLKENTVKTKRTRAKQKIREILDIGGKNNGWAW